MLASVPVFFDFFAIAAGEGLGQKKLVFKPNKNKREPKNAKNEGGGKAKSRASHLFCNGLEQIKTSCTGLVLYRAGAQLFGRAQIERGIGRGYASLSRRLVIRLFCDPSRGGGRGRKISLKEFQRNSETR